MRRRKNKTPHQLSEEQEEYAMKEYLLADCFLFKNALELLCKKVLGRDKEEIERKIMELKKKTENRIKYLTLLEPVFELTELLEKEGLSEQEREYFTQRRKSLRDNFKNDRLYKLIWEYHEKLNGR